MQTLPVPHSILRGTPVSEPANGDSRQNLGFKKMRSGTDVQQKDGKRIMQGVFRYRFTALGEKNVPIWNVLSSWIESLWMFLPDML